jgi:outer membrane murein-binding lipoprotein Lpp
MKAVGVILAMIVVAFAVNILMGGGEVTKAHFDERINEINARIDSVRADVAKVWNVSRETKVNTDSIKAEVRTLDGKVDEIAKDVKDIKTTTKTIEFKLF